MEHNMLALDFWQDTVTYEDMTFPTGTIGCDALNISNDVIQKLNQLCEPLNKFMKALNTLNPDPALLPVAKDAVIQILNLLHTVPPFSYLDMDFYISGISKAFTEQGVQDFITYSTAVLNSVIPLYGWKRSI